LCQNNINGIEIIPIKNEIDNGAADNVFDIIPLTEEDTDDLANVRTKLCVII